MSTPLDATVLPQLQHWLARCDGLLICAGAGMGVDSGLPDFRGNEGFWRAYPALRGRNFTEVACPQTFEEDLALAWGFYGHRLRLYRDTVPHAGFADLLALGQAMPAGYFVYTSNVDGQFQKAGYDPQRLVECHGSIHHLQCGLPCGDRVWSASDFQPQVDVQRPLVVELGAGTAVPSVRIRAESVARRGHLLRINPRQYGVSGDHALGLPLGAQAGAALLRRAVGL